MKAKFKRFSFFVLLLIGIIHSPLMILLGKNFAVFALKTSGIFPNMFAFSHAAGQEFYAYRYSYSFVMNNGEKIEFDLSKKHLEAIDDHHLLHSTLMATAFVPILKFTPKEFGFIFAHKAYCEEGMIKTALGLEGKVKTATLIVESLIDKDEYYTRTKECP